MTIHELPAGTVHSASTIWTFLLRLSALAAGIRNQAWDNEAQHRAQLQLDRLDDVRLADLGLARHVVQVGWRSTVRGAEPLPVMKNVYEPLAAEAPERID